MSATREEWRIHQIRGLPTSTPEPPRSALRRPGRFHFREEVVVLSRGNHKLGGSRIWGFGLPAGAPNTCPGMSPVCQTHCYAVAFERYRPTASALYLRNLRLAHRRDFVRRVR